MSEDNKTVVPETVSKTTVLICLGFCLISGMLGFAFGADAGYDKGLKDCQNTAIPQQALVNP